MPKECCVENFNKIGKKEPVFILRANDMLSPEIVRIWIDKAKEKGVSQNKIQKAYQHLADIISYQENNYEKVKLPD